ncbi:MAG: type II toxin-antitoxin system VapC family toxin [Candidatus Paceibacterales bacterium]
MVILDSNVWISFLNIDDYDHKKAERVFRKLKEKIVLTEYILLEVVTIISQKISKDLADSFIRTVIDNKDIEILASSKEFLDEIIKFYLSKKNKNLSFVDYSLLYLSQKTEIITFDKILKKELKKLS